MASFIEMSDEIAAIRKALWVSASSRNIVARIFLTALVGRIVFRYQDTMIDVNDHLFGLRHWIGGEGELPYEVRCPKDSIHESSESKPAARRNLYQSRQSQTFGYRFAGSASEYSRQVGCVLAREAKKLSTDVDN